eukprot:1541094-Pyramimonas_sp.AAC.1
MRKLGWKTFFSQCEVTAAMGRSAGVAILVRAHLDAWSDPRRQNDLVAHRFNSRLLPQHRAWHH